MSKITEIAIVVGLVVVVGVTIAVKQANRSSSSRSVKPGTSDDVRSVSADATSRPAVASRPAPNQVAAAKPAPPSKKQIPRLVDLGADKCIPCKMMAPILEELKREYAGRLRVDFIDVWKNPNAGKQYGIRVIPTQIFYDASGKERFRHQGFFSKQDILAKWKELGIDLDDANGRPEGK